jgi:ketosteroid isomerase-like protein
MAHEIRVAAFLLLAGVSSACQRPAIQPADLNAEGERIRARSRQLVDAEGRKDVDKILPFYTQDAVSQPPGAPAAEGHAAIRKFYADFYQAVPLVSFTATINTVNVAQAGDLAYETGINRFLIDKAGTQVEDLGKYLAVWRKVNGEWYVAAVSFSSDRPAQ